MNSSNKYIQYGCGWSYVADWRNFDASPTLRFERLPILGRLYTKNSGRFPKEVEYGDIVTGLPLSDDSCKGIYCSHILEHLSYDDCIKSLSNTYKLLQDGGVFRLVLPDFEVYVKQYAKSMDENSAADFMKSTSLGIESRPRGLSGFIKNWLGNSSHLWMWDYKGLAKELENAGFKDIRRAYYGDSSDSKFNEIENKDRWDGCLGIECKK